VESGTRIAITRQVSRSFESCLLTHLERQSIDLELARRQHAAYEQTLAGLGCEILQLPEQPDLPDAVFVEDVAVVLDEVAVMTRPGALSRRAELRSIRQALQEFRPILQIEKPAILDGGDILKAGGVLYVGLSGRTNRRGASQLQRLVQPFGYQVRQVPVQGCLHLKSAVTLVGQEILLLNPAWVDSSYFAGFQLVEVHPTEPLAANALLLEERVIFPANFPATRDRLERAGCRVLSLDVSEIGKAEGGVTCCSLIFKV